VAQTIQDLGDRYVFGNQDGTFTVWKQVTDLGSGLVVGPGYVGRAIFRTNGDRIDGAVPASVSMNDPRWQGLGGFGWHHYRAIPGEDNIWNKGWELLAHRAADPADPFGVSSGHVLVDPYVNEAGEIRASFGVDFVDRYSAAEGRRVMFVRYDYIVDASQVKVWVTAQQQPDGFDAGPPVFVKEPKLDIGVGGDSYRPHTLDVFRADSSLLRSIDLVNDPKLQDPSVGTVQVGFDTRCRLRFYDGSNYFNVVARASDTPTYGLDGRPNDYGHRSPWEDSFEGFDAWALLADRREEFASSPCDAYCKQGGKGTGPGFLTRQWEVAKRRDEPDVLVMLHAWEGGAGLPDCLCCAKAFSPGEKWTAFLSISRDAGWQI
jgi:hypothetical protein